MITTIDEYIAQFPEEIQKKLSEIRAIIKEVIPDETIEKISWGMPTFHLKTNLVHFAAAKNHVGFYPGNTGIEQFQEQFKAAGYKFTKGGVQFKYKDPLPKDLIQEIVKFRVEENTK